MRKVFLEDLPRRGKGIDWKSSIGQTVKFIYDDIKGDIYINKYIDGEKSIINVIYKNHEFDIRTSILTHCMLGGLIKYKCEQKQIPDKELKDNEFTYDEMMQLINQGFGEIKYQYNKIVNGVVRMLIFYNGNYYIQCTQCRIFKQIDKFTTNKKNIGMMQKSGACKECCSHRNKQSYYNNYERYIYYRYKSLEQNSKKRNVECLSFEDFKIFAETNKDPVYNMTLKESFENGMYDKLDVDHKIPISKGGSSLIDNLYLIPSEFNRLKLDKSLDETLAIIKLLYEKSENIKQFYNTEEVKL